MPLVASPTSSEDVPNVEELRLARVVVDAVVVVADVDVAVVHEGHALDLLVKQAAGRLEVGHEVLDERLLDRGRRVRGPGGGRELVDALDAGVGPELVVPLEDEELAIADERDVREPDPAAVRRLGRVAAQAALAAAGGLRAPGRVNPELEPTDDEIEAELNTMLGAPAAAAALADVKQEA